MDKRMLDKMSGQEIKEMIFINKLSWEELDTTALEKLLDFETDRLCIGLGDMEIIDKCSRLLNDANADNILSDQDVMRIIENTKAKYVTIVDTDAKSETRGKRIKIFRRIGLIAAVMALLFVGTTVIAAAFGVDILQCIADVVREPEGTKIDVEGFTFYHNGEGTQYSSIAEMIEKENLDIIYPTKLPEGISIDYIEMTKNAKGNEIIQVATNDTGVGFSIELSVDNFETTVSDIYEKEGKTYYIEKRNFYVAISYYKGNRYYITAETKEDLILIIDNIQE